MSAAELDGRRAIRARNAEAILDAAIDVLNADPQAGMHEVAAAAGVGRATLYRHYPARDDLVTAIGARARETFDALVADLKAGEDQRAALERFVAGLLSLREGYACIAVRAAPRPDRETRQLWAPLEDHVRRVQAQGKLPRELDPGWVVAAFRGLLRAAAAQIDDGRLSRRAAPALVVGTLLGGVGGG